MSTPGWAAIAYMAETTLENPVWLHPPCVEIGSLSTVGSITHQHVEHACGNSGLPPNVEQSTKSIYSPQQMASCTASARRYAQTGVTCCGLSISWPSLAPKAHLITSLTSLGFRTMVQPTSIAGKTLAA